MPRALSFLSPQPPYDTNRPLRRREVKHLGAHPENLERGGRYFFIYIIKTQYKDCILLVSSDHPIQNRSK